MQQILPTSVLTASRRLARPESHSETAYRLIRERIITLKLPPASLLNEEQLMAELGLGRTPIREALQRLSLEGLVIILPRRGTMVADVNLSDLQKIFELRLELEVLAVRLAAQRATPQEIAAMEDLFADFDAVSREADNPQLIRIDQQAHHLLAQAAHNEFLEETLDWLYTHVLRLWYVPLHKVHNLRDAIQEHREIVAALKAGDGERAAAIMRAHVAGFQSEVTAVLANSIS